MLEQGDIISLKDNKGKQISINFSLSIGERTILGFGEFDINVCALLLQNGKLVSTDDIISYRNTRHKTGTIWLHGGNTEQSIVFKTDLIPIEYDTIVFYATIHNGQRLEQDFLKIESIHNSITNTDNTELGRYTILKRKPDNKKSSMIMGKVVRNDDAWTFNDHSAIRDRNAWDYHAIGEAYRTDDLMKIADMYK